jgi:hypothetical protein
VAEDVVVEIDLGEVTGVVFIDPELVAGVGQVTQGPIAVFVHAAAVEADGFAECVDIRREERRRRTCRHLESVAEIVDATKIRGSDSELSQRRVLGFLRKPLSLVRLELVFALRDAEFDTQVVGQLQVEVDVTALVIVVGLTFEMAQRREAFHQRPVVGVGEIEPVADCRHGTVSALVVDEGLGRVHAIEFDQQAGVVIGRT